MRNAYIRPTGGLAVLVASLFAVVLIAQQSPRELFERARLLEDSNQDLAEAISLYGQVVEQASGQRALAATAQLRLGRLRTPRQCDRGWHQRDCRRTRARGGHEAL